MNADVVGAGDIVVTGAGSTLNLETGTIVQPNGGGRIIIGDDAMLQFWNVGAGGATRITRAVEMGDGSPSSKSFLAAGGGVSTLGSPILLRGDLILRNNYSSTANSTLTLTGDVSEDATSRRLIKTNTGRLILAGSNSFTGGLEITTGTSPSPGAGTTGIVQLGSAGALDPANVVTFAPAAGFTGILQLGGNSATIAGLQATSLAGTAFVENASATPATLTINNVADSRYEAALRDGTGGGSLALTKTGSGTLTLSGTNTYTGPTNVLAGTLQIDGTHTGGADYTVAAAATLAGGGTVTSSVFASGTIAPGASAGALTVSALTLDGGATVDIELGGTALGSQYDHLEVIGQAVLDGTLDVSLIGGFAPLAGHSFDVLDWGTRSGTFATLTLPTLTPGLMWNASHLDDTGVVSVRLAGDYNQDDAVDTADYVVWRKMLGQTGTALAADGNGNGEIDAGDYDVWTANLGLSSVARARSVTEGTLVTIHGVVTNTTDLVDSGSSKDFHLQDGTAGMRVFGTTARINELLAGVNEGDSVVITGVFGSFNGAAQLLDTGSALSLTVTGSPGLVSPTTVTVSDFADFSPTSEGLEHTLVRLENVSFIESGTFAGLTNYTVTDGVSQAVVRVSTNQQDTVGTPIPTGPVA